MNHSEALRTLLHNTPVMLVEDDADIRELFTQLLQNLGARVRAAADGREALEIAETEPLAAVITDLRMPRMDGLELIRSLREQGLHMPIMIMSAHSELLELIDLMDLDIQHFVFKPVHTKLFCHELLCMLGGGCPRS